MSAVLRAPAMMAASTSRPTSVRCCAASAALAVTSCRRQASRVLQQLAHTNPGQWSSFHGVKMLLPQVALPRGKGALKLVTSLVYRKPAQMSFLGVGAPEAILVGIVALLVFGPKGLAEAARGIGGALRAFQPTIKEVVEVSQELKGTLEKELGLDELREAARPTPRARPVADDEAGAAAVASAAPLTAVSDTVARAIDPDIEAKRAASMQAAWGGAAPTAAAVAAQADSTAAPAAAATSGAPKPVSAMSLEELEAELERRRKERSTA